MTDIVAQTNPQPDSPAPRNIKSCARCIAARRGRELRPAPPEGPDPPHGPPETARSAPAVVPGRNSALPPRNNDDKAPRPASTTPSASVTGMSAEEHTLTVRTDEDESSGLPGFDELDELAHAYAVTSPPLPGQRDPAGRSSRSTTSSWIDAPAQSLLYTG